MIKHNSSKIPDGVKTPLTLQHSRLFFIVSLTVVFAVILNIQAIFPFGFGQTDAFDGIFYYPALMLIGFVVGFNGLIRLPRVFFDVWIASFLGHMIYIVTFTMFSSYDLNLLPFALIFCAFFSFIPYGCAFLGNYIFCKRHRK